MLKEKTTIELPDKVIDFFYYQNHIICKATRKVILYNTLTKSMHTIPTDKDEFVV